MFLRCEARQKIFSQCFQRETQEKPLRNAGNFFDSDLVENAVKNKFTVFFPAKRGKIFEKKIRKINLKSESLHIKN